VPVLKAHKVLGIRLLGFRKTSEYFEYIT